MYLSRMNLNPRRRGTRGLLGNPQAMHAAVMSAFPPDAHGEGRPLWRTDKDGDRLALYLVSPTPPSFEHLQEQSGWANQQSWQIRPYGPILDRLMLGQHYSFRLTANPVRTVTDNHGVKKRCAHVTVAQQVDWLTSRAEDSGFRLVGLTSAVENDPAVPAVAVTARETLRFPRGGRTVTIARAQFDGVLEVTDVDEMRKTLTTGLGKAKAYGCGLMTLARSGS